MKERLKVVLLVNELVVGGAERQLVELARGLDHQRFDPLIVTLYAGGPLEAELEGDTTVRFTSLRRSSKYDLSSLGRLVTLLRAEKAQIIQPFLTPATFFGLTAAQLARTPVRIVTERCGLRGQVTVGNRLYRSVEDQLTRFADAAVANSEAGKSYLLDRRIPAHKVHVVYNGVNPSRTTASEEEMAAVRRGLNLPDGAPVVGIVASLEPAKDHETFLRAAAIVRRQRPDSRFLIIGEGSLRPGLQQQAESLGLSDSVRFTGNLLRVSPYIGAFTVAVLSSCDHEGCSNFILEAMGMAKAVVATQIGGNAELVTPGESGLLAPPRDAGSLAAAILRLLNDDALARSMGEAGRRRFERQFKLSRMVGAYERIYEDLWARHAGRARAAAGTLEQAARQS